MTDGEKAPELKACPYMGNKRINCAADWILFGSECKQCCAAMMLDTLPYKPDSEQWKYIADNMVRNGGSIIH